MTLLAKSIHVDLVAEQIRHRCDVRRKAGQSQVSRRSVVEDLGEVVGDREGLHAQSEITGDGDAVLADHGNTGTTIYTRSASALSVVDVKRNEGSVLISNGELWMEMSVWSIGSESSLYGGLLQDIPWW